jgi:hypothetical protein
MLLRNELPDLNISRALAREIFKWAMNFINSISQKALVQYSIYHPTVNKSIYFSYFPLSLSKFEVTQPPNVV